MKLQTSNQIYKIFKEKYSQYAPDFELKIKAEQVAKLNKLVVEKNAVILKHNYMSWDLQCDEVLGIRGDSLELSRKATETDADVILFLGVKFMAETAKVLNPSKTVLIPSLKAGCSLASSITGADVRKLKEMFPGVPVVAYVNTDADTKSEVDVCCASGNAAKVVKWAMQEWKTNKVIFLPDKFLAQNIAKQMGADIFFPNMSKTKEENQKQLSHLRSEIRDLESPLFISWEGKCEVHEKFTATDVKELRKDFPGVYVMAHPECPPEVINEVDFAGSTGEMIKNIIEPDIQDKQVAFFTECAMVEMLAASHKNVLQVCSIQKRCPHMAQNNLETVIDALENMQYEVTVPEELRAKAEIPIRRMIAIK
jgi:quinolinate synthase